MSRQARIPDLPPDDHAVEDIVQGRHGDPFAVLGPHGAAPVGIRVFRPEAEAVDVVDARGDVLATLDKVHPAGFFAGAVDGADRELAYRLKVTGGGRAEIIEDPYRFPAILGDLDTHLMLEGTHLELYRRLGAHPLSLGQVDGIAFAVWAPNARRVSVVGPFNRWDGRVHPMRLRHDAGVWELFIPGLEEDCPYKFEIMSREGNLLPLKADPFAFASEHPPATASLIHGLTEHRWRDGDWLRGRAEACSREAPISIYECHLASWMREDGRYLTYDELAERLIPYVRDLGFTHIECLPLSEYPFDGSWGYQPIGLFAPTRRFGAPDAFARFVDRIHQAGLGLILDWVPAHFPSDAHGLASFDGTALFEHADPRQGFHRDWNTLIYNYGRREVQNFLLSNALFWLDRYHVDALRVDAVASMLYLDYSRAPGEWVPNREGGNQNLDAVEFLQRLNRHVFARHPGATMIAEESTAWPGVSRPVDTGGLGFGYKWNLGWMHDTLSYMSREPVHRKYHHNDLTFGLHYAFSENFVLPLSHDEVVHGKGSLIAKMPGDAWQKFANLRAYLGFMWSHPGKKLLFMGGEFAQWIEWNHDRQLDWHLLDDPPHRGVQRLVGDLNRIYRELPALHELDCEPEGFEWIEAGDAENSVVAFLRKGRGEGQTAVVVSNFTAIPRHDYLVGVPAGGLWQERLNTDAEAYGGSGVGNYGRVGAVEEARHGRPFALALTLPPLATVILEPETAIQRRETG